MQYSLEVESVTNIFSRSGIVTIYSLEVESFTEYSLEEWNVTEYSLEWNVIRNIL